MQNKNRNRAIIFASLSVIFGLGIAHSKAGNQSNRIGIKAASPLKKLSDFNLPSVQYEETQVIDGDTEILIDLHFKSFVIVITDINEADHLPWFHAGLYVDKDLVEEIRTTNSHGRATTSFSMVYEGTLDAGLHSFSSRLIKDHEFNPTMTCDKNKLRVIVIPFNH